MWWSRIAVFRVLSVILLSANNVCGFLTSDVELSPGTFVTGLKKKGYDAFYGISFAKPPVGDLRFRVI